MDTDKVEHLVRDIKLCIERASFPVPVGVSNRHLHLTREHFKALFGADAEPALFRRLVQPGFFACNEKVDMETPHRNIGGVRMIGPYRARTQIEISAGDAVKLGLRPPIRDSGRLENSPGITIRGPKGSVRVNDGVIISKRHIHFSPAEAKQFKIEDGTEARVRCGCGGDRELVFEKVLCRVSDKFSLEFHLDVEEANAAMVKNGDPAYIVG
ncbi:MAG: phosphate propanoyltransferase [bacterium]